jgi:hypothetical protein
MLIVHYEMKDGMPFWQGVRYFVDSVSINEE